MPTPEISVVVPSHGRRLRLWWLLNALEEQTLEAERWEVVVVHDYDDPEFLGLLERHPLAADARLRCIRIPRGTGHPARQRNIGWRAARAPLIAFTDDDCRPQPEWLERLLEAAVDRETILQGATRPDPLEIYVSAAPHFRSVFVDPPNRFAQTCNIAYPRRLLERVDGFDEVIAAGDDTDLALRAEATGAARIGVPEALVHHAVESFSLVGVIRMNRKWQHLPYLYRQHPELRRECTLGIFWRPTHFELLLALMGAAGARRRPLLGVLSLPYLARALRARGTGRRARLASLLELPGKAIVDLGEIATMIKGSIRYRSVLI